ncbi:hypothetical protein WN944_026937 [Citrus x changshan-huyou]|uniref:Uncharacterized protein n=1 Tax=Citrus x changshan-huyou TaxID=2935761 RepID=A0AAP0Q8P9_9ROSI
MVWSNLSKNLMSQIEQIEGGLRLMVQALISRIKKKAAPAAETLFSALFSFSKRKEDRVMRDSNGVVLMLMKKKMHETASFALVSGFDPE